MEFTIVAASKAYPALNSNSIDKQSEFINIFGLVLALWDDFVFYVNPVVSILRVVLKVFFQNSGFNSITKNVLLQKSLKKKTIFVEIEIFNCWMFRSTLDILVILLLLLSLLFLVKHFSIQNKSVELNTLQVKTFIYKYSLPIITKIYHMPLLVVTK